MRVCVQMKYYCEGRVTKVFLITHVCMELIFDFLCLHCPIMLILSPIIRLSPLRRGSLVHVLYHMRDIKGRHILITWRWTKLGVHAHSSTSIFKTTRVFFLGKYFMWYLCLCSQHYVDVHIQDFLSQLDQQRSQLTTHKITCQSASLVPLLTL